MAEVASAEPATAEEPALEFELPAESSETLGVGAASEATGAQEEVDLSDEWASMLEDSHPAELSVNPTPSKTPAPPPPPEVAAEPVAAEEFSIAEEPVAAAHSDSHDVQEFELTVEEPPVAEEETRESHAFADISAELPAETESESAPPVVEVSHAPAVPEPPPVPQAPAAHEPPVVHHAPAPPPAPEPEFELQQDFELVLEPEPLVPAYDQRPPETPVVQEPEPEPEPAVTHAAHGSTTSTTAPPAGGFASDQFLADLAQEIDDLGLDALVPSKSQAAAPQASVPQAAAPAKPEEKPARPAEHSPLQEVFEDFRAELGEMGAEDEDLETHYNLGTAFREMGLLDEAISEFQKVAKATERGKPFRYGMQCCTLLGLAFMEKGQPGIAAIWYERALHTPGIEPESILALRYDLGVAQESAGEPVAALKSFSQVYAMNIDYRDVADRIAALQKPIR